MLRLQTAPAEARSGGRSRYSKALPSVPIAGDGSPPLPAIPAGNEECKNVERIRSIARKPVGSSALKPGTASPLLTPLLTASPVASSSALSTASPAASSAAPTMRTIPRRPVGAALSLPATRPSVVPPERSPTDSICSLLSAYTREPDDSLSGSTYTTASTSNDIPDSGGKSSPTAARDGPPGGRSQNPPEQPAAATSSEDRVFAPNGGRRPAPAAPVGASDKLNSQPKPLPPDPSPVLESEQTASRIHEPGRFRPQAVESRNKDLQAPEPHHSCGSAASISSIETAAIRASSDTVIRHKGTEDPAQPTPSPRPPVKVLPGRENRPAATAELDGKPQPSTHPMGRVASKVANIKNKLATSSKNSEPSRFPIRSDSMRPPTPEYRKGDINPPSPPHNSNTKPASPISAYGSPKQDEELTDVSKKLPPPPSLSSRPEARPEIPFVHTTSLGPTSQRRPPAAMSDPRSVMSQPDFRPSPPDDESFSASRKPIPHPSERNRDPGILPNSRSYSAHPSGSDEMSIVPASGRRPGMTSDEPDARIAHSDAQEVTYRGRDGTLYAEMKTVGTPDPKASYFPRQTDQQLGPGAVIPARPLNQSHFNCYQKHKTMNRRSNRYYSLTCQTCDRADAEDRWVCSFCHLRICDSCQRALNGHQRVLQSLVDQLTMGTSGSPSYVSRPGSALGLEPPA